MLLEKIWKTKRKRNFENLAPITLNGSDMPWVKKVNHLGCILKNTYSMRADILSKHYHFITTVNSLLQSIKPCSFKVIFLCGFWIWTYNGLTQNGSKIQRKMCSLVFFCILCCKVVRNFWFFIHRTICPLNVVLMLPILLWFIAFYGIKYMSSKIHLWAIWAFFFIIFDKIII